jgi:asparagine synthase (glutamine-hydrolysing)
MLVFLGGYLLSSQGDRVAMAHSVEIRMPYLDYRVVEFGARLPTVWRILGLREKFLLRKAAAAWVPDRIVQRGKHPYRAPIAGPLLGQASQGWREALPLRPGGAASHGLFDLTKVERLIRKLSADGGSERENMALTGILSTLLCQQQFVESAPAETSLPPAAPVVVVDRCSLR